MEEFILFCMSYILIFIIYQIFIIIPAKKRKNNSKKKKSSKEVLEIKYLTTRYHLDLKKIKYEQLLQICGLVSSLDIALGVFFVNMFHNFFLEFFGGILIVIVLIFISYYFVYLFYKKKGMILDGKRKND